MIRQVIDLYASNWDFFLHLAWQHIWISGAAILLAVLFGLGLGIAASERASLAAAVAGAMNTLRAIPAIALFGLAFPLTGGGNATAIAVLSLCALLPTVRAVYSGLRGIDPALVEAAEGMGSTKGQVLLRIKLPLALPGIFSGLRATAVMTTGLAGFAAFIGAGGLGVAVYRGVAEADPAMVLAASLLIIVLSLGLGGMAGRVGAFCSRLLGYANQKPKAAPIF